jgi:hypothetical protein
VHFGGSAPIVRADAVEQGGRVPQVRVRRARVIIKNIVLVCDQHAR